MSIRKTKIICTLGPSVDSDESIEKLILNGMDTARFNFSHGTHEEHKVRMDRVKRIREKLGTSTSILLDTKGPEIRVKDFKDGQVFLEDNQEFIFDDDETTLGDEHRIGLTYHELYLHVKKGTSILADDGKLAFEVLFVENHAIHCKVIHGGKFSNHKSLNLPGTTLPMPYLSQADQDDLLFGIEQEVDFIAASFVRSPKDVLDMRKFLLDHGGEGIKIISKIENTDGLKNFDEILKVTDGIMVARGDLGVEIPFDMIPSVQKNMIRKCIAQGVFVVTATQMLESMTSSPRPTRAEVSDVANAIYDGTTAIMLSGETAAGLYPVEAVATMAKIALTTESSINYDERFKQKDLVLSDTILDATCVSACTAAEYLDTAAIVVVSKSGRSVARLADFYPNCPIIAGIVSDRGRHQMNLAFNVIPLKAETVASVDTLVDYAKELALQSHVVRKGNRIVIVTGKGDNAEHSSDTIKIEVL